MKLNFFILQLALSLKVIICFSQTTTLKLATYVNCENSYSDYYVSSINIFALPSDNLIFSKVENEETGSELNGKILEITNLPIGIYRISFKKHEADKVRQNKFITLKAIPANYVNLCLFDKNVDVYNPFIGITHKDSLVINVREVGCWDHIQYRVIFKKIGKDIFARMEHYLVTCRIFTKDGNEHVSKSPVYITQNKKVTDKQINDLVIAFSNTKLVKPHDCSIHTSYEITINKSKTLLEDGSCIKYVNHFNEIFKIGPYEVLRKFKPKENN